jgi:diguanylate cyclase (GGDEF)-like protein
MNQTIPVLMLLLLLLMSITAAYLLSKARAEKKVKGIQQAYRLATEMANEGFYTVHPVISGKGAVINWIFTDCNDRGAAYFGLQRHEVIGKHVSHLFWSTSFEKILEICALATKEGYYEDQCQETPDSLINVKWVHRQLARTKDGLAISFKDISSDKKHVFEMSRLANEDSITTLPNRRWLADFLPKALQEATGKVALLFIDLDDFKNVNDALGHPVGDLLLRATAMRLKSVVGANDQVVRLGGDEFVIVLTDLSNEGEARCVAELINEILRFPLELVKGKKSITTSIGISFFPDNGVDMDTLLKSAEMAMYSAKDNGKAHYRFYNPTLYEKLKSRLSFEQELSDAIDKNEFVIFYEPRMNVSTGRLSGMEALVRWAHPERGLIQPLEFIPLAESTGLILELGDLIINEVFKQIVVWRSLNLPVRPVSINISAHQFNTGNVGKTFLDALEKYDISPDLIEIELTESAMLGDQTLVINTLSEIRSLGIKLLIDDFGTGYSSLAQLQLLKMDTLKVDRAFLKNLDRTREGEVFVKAIISMAHALGMGVIAEGVETRAQLDILRSLRCDEVQGYYLSRPLPADAMEQLLTLSNSPMINHWSAVS